MHALERYRIASELTYQALAAILDVDKGRAFRWCNGLRIIPAKHVVAIEAATGVSRTDLRPDLYDPPVRRRRTPELPANSDLPVATKPPGVVA